MRIVLDLETYYDDEYSLKRMPTLEYVRDERFLIHGAAIKVDDDPTITWCSEKSLRGYLEEFSQEEYLELICHNTYFDGLALYHHYQFVPTVYRDTLSMARGLLPHAPSYELDYLCKLLGIGEKVPEVLGLTKGHRILSPELFRRLGEYAVNDVDLTSKLYDRLNPGLPDEEAQLIDLTMRWACRPTLRVDTTRLARAYRAALRERRDRIRRSGVELEVLSSQPKFAAHLGRIGVEVPLKRNTKGKEIPALAKNDIGFHRMMADYPEHHDLFQGRIAAKSTIGHTRMKRIYKIGTANSGSGSSGTLPMPLKYYGAHTGRWSGTDGLNPQNFVRGSELRKSIIAPPGYVLVVSDLKQIEPRMNMLFCGENYWLEVFRQGMDIYTATAAVHFDVPYEDVTKSQRFFGKTLELGLGYNMGWQKFRTQCALRGIFLNEAEAYKAVTKYRNTHFFVVTMWRDLSNMLSVMYADEAEPRVKSPVAFVHEAIRLPNGMQLDYSGLTPTESGDWYYGLNGKRIKIYGGKILENIIQALSRIVIGEHLLAIEVAGYCTVSSTHDEILAVVREGDADQAVEDITAIMTTPPDWAPDLPLAVDIGYAKEYSK